MTAASVKPFIQDTLSSNAVVVFSKTYCPFCHKAKAALQSLIPADKFLVVEVSFMDAFCHDDEMMIWRHVRWAVGFEG